VSCGSAPASATATPSEQASTQELTVLAADAERIQTFTQEAPGDVTGRSEGHNARSQLSGADTGEPSVELVCLGDLAAEVDVTVGTDSCAH
jgi:hypothetical protein